MPRSRLTAVLFLLAVACSACGSAGTGGPGPSASATDRATPTPSPAPTPTPVVACADRVFATMTLDQRIGQLFPQSWAMDAWIKLIADHAGLGGILPQLAVLGAFAVVLLPLSTWRLRRSIVA